MTTEIFTRQDGTFLNVEFIDGDTSRPGIVYLHGLLSNITSKKGRYLKAFARKKGLSYLCFDFSAHGQSWGQPSDFMISRCLQDALDVLKKYTSTPQIIVGSSMGGWIGLLLCKHVPQKVHAFIGLAPGPDFTKFIWNNLLSEQHKEALKGGVVLGPSEETKGYCFTYQMFQDAEKHFILDNPLLYNGPVRLLQGDKDVLVPYQTAFKIKDVLTSEDLIINLIKGGDHALSSPEHLSILGTTLEGILNQDDNKNFAKGAVEK